MPDRPPGSADQEKKVDRQIIQPAQGEADDCEQQYLIMQRL